MANNYEQIMALVNAGNKMGLSNTITRDNGIPLDLSSVYSSYNDAVVYAATKAIAYHGQPIAVITETDATLYVITPVSQGKVTIGETEYDVYLKQVGAKTLGDEKSIVLSDNGVLSLYGFEAAANSTLPRKDPTTGKLEWVAIDQIVSGDGNTKTVVTAAEGADITVTPSYDVASDTYTYTLDVTLPEVPEYSVTKVAGDGVVTYTVTKDGEAIGESIVVPNAYNDSSVISRIAAVEASTTDHTARIESIEAFFRGAAADEGEGESLVNALDTLKEIQEYINNDGEVAKTVTANATAIATLVGTGDGSIAKTVSEAIAAQAATDASTYATQSSLAEVKATADAAAVKSEVETALAGKVDNATLNNYYTKTDTYTKTEVTELIAGITGDTTESTASLLSKLETHEATAAEKFTALEAKDSAQDTTIKANTDAIAAINNPETGLLVQAATAAQTKVDTLANGIVAQHTTDISAINAKIDTINGNITTFSGNIAALQQADVTLQANIEAEASARGVLAGTVSGHTAKITALETKDSELEAAIANNAGKFDDYYTKTQVDAKFDELSHTALEESIAANTKAIQDEASRADTEEKRLAGLIGTNASAIEKNAADISALDTAIKAVIDDEDGSTLNSIKDLATWIAEHDDSDTGVLKAVNDNTAAIEKLNGDVNTAGSVKKTVADAIAAIPVATASAVGLVKASDEVTVAADGTMGVGYVSTDKLIQGSVTLVLNGGSAEVTSTEATE